MDKSNNPNDFGGSERICEKCGGAFARRTKGDFTDGTCTDCVNHIASVLEWAVYRSGAVSIK